MKHTFWIVIVGLLIGTPVAMAEMTAGYANSRSREVLAKFEAGHRTVSLYNRATDLIWGKRSEGEGRLWIVNSRGKIRVSATAFSDRNGLHVGLPEGEYDKIVVLNWVGAIYMGIGLSETEMMNLVPRSDQTHARLIVNAQSRPFFGALRYASPMLSEMRGSVEDILDTFASSLQWMGGVDVEQFVRVILNQSYFHEVAVSIRVAGKEKKEVAQSLFPGVGLIAQGGNGGGGDSLVAQGGNGNGGDSLVAQGGNGGGGDSLVAQGGNGGGGDSLVAQGGNGNGGDSHPMERWEKSSETDVSLQGGVVSIDIPAFSGLNAVTQGSVIVLQ